jgi:hypothetical protein
MTSGIQAAESDRVVQLFAGYHRLEFPPIVMFKVFLTSGAVAGSVVYMSGKKLIRPGETHPICFVPPPIFCTRSQRGLFHHVLSANVPTCKLLQFVCFALQMHLGCVSFRPYPGCKVASYFLTSPTCSIKAARCTANSQLLYRWLL